MDLLREGAGADLEHALEREALAIDILVNNVGVIEVYRATVPFFLILLATVLIITYWPALSLVWIDGRG
jgi:TRAP-type mannitol/chloroaromatic compound transport system permease large subunit